QRRRAFARHYSEEAQRHPEESLRHAKTFGWSRSRSSSVGDLGERALEVLAELDDRAGAGLQGEVWREVAELRGELERARARVVERDSPDRDLVDLDLVGGVRRTAGDPGLELVGGDRVLGLDLELRHRARDGHARELGL